MTIVIAAFLLLAGLAVGSFLNVCIDRLPPKRNIYMVDKKGGRLDIEISNKTFFDDPIKQFKDKDILVTGKIFKNTATGNYQITVTRDSQIVLPVTSAGSEAAAVAETPAGADTLAATDTPLTLEEAKSKAGTTVTVSVHITGGEVKRASLVSPPSHCDSCGRQLTVLDNIPIFSYLFLGGKCRYCKAHIGPRVLLVEILTAAVFLLAYWRLGANAQYAVTVFFACIFIVVIFIDWEQTLILNSITYPAMIIALILLAVDSFAPGANLFGDRLFLPHTSLYSGLISGAALFLIFILIAIITPGSMGIGDAKLVALIGLVSGFPLMIFSMIIGIVIGGVVAVILLAARKKGRKDVIPYGTFLAIGPIIAMLLPAGVMDWYLSFGR